MRTLSYEISYINKLKFVKKKKKKPNSKMNGNQMKRNSNMNLFSWGYLY